MSSVLQAGTTVSHYRIVSRLGAGGMGEVYKAQDTKLDRTVALKILPPEVVKNEDRVRRFVQEAKAASGLSHPHIVAIHEIGEEAGDGKAAIHFIAMEFVNGVTLRTKIHDANTNLRDLLEYLAQAADALAKAHAAGIVHRDLKPDNIMVTQDGYAKVLDFGLAKLIERQLSSSGSGVATAVRQQTREGVVVGTVGYMSPEQVKAQPVDHRSDIFSLGCILYEAATKQKPFAADSDVDVMHKIIHDEPQSVSEINPSVPAELRRMIRRCLAKDPDRRYQSMKDVAIELRDLSQEFETLTPSGSTSAPSAVLPRPRWHTPVIAIGIVIALAIVTLLLLRPFRDLSRPPAGIQMSFTQLTDYAGVESTPRFSPDGTFIVFTRGLFRNRDIYLQRIGGRKPINLTDSPSDDFQPAMSPDGQLIAFRSTRQGGGIFVMGATGESVKRLTNLGFDPAWSPDGKEIVVATEGPENPGVRSIVSQLWRVRYPGGERTLISKGDAVQPSWSPHGHRIAYWGRPTGSGQRDIWTIPSAGGEAIPVTSDSALDWNPVWSPDGNYLYFSSDRGGSMNLWRIAIDEQTGKTSGAAEAITTPAPWAGRLDISRDGRRILFAAEDTQSHMHRVGFDPVAGNIVGNPHQVTGGSFQTIGVDIAPDGTRLTFRSTGVQEDIHVMRSDGTEIRKLTDDVARDRGPRWSPDGKQIAFFSDRSGRYEIWTVDPDSGELRQVTDTTGPSTWFPIWSPDAKRLVVSNETGAYLVNLTRGLPVRVLEPLPAFSKDETFEATDWSPDGQWLTGGTRKNGEIQPGVMIYSFERRAYDKLADQGGRSAWLNDSRRILFRDVAREGQFFVVDRITRKVRQISRFDQPQRGAFFSLTSDNRTLFFQDFNVEADIWMLTMK